MITYDPVEFESDKFAVQVIAKGSYVDRPTGDGKAYLLETTTLRLNHVAHNAWLFSETSNSRGCYETEAEWQAHLEQYKGKREKVEAKIKAEVGVPQDKSAFIIQIHAETFTVLTFSELTPEQPMQ